MLRSIVWFPTFRCQYSCAYCNARSLPVDSHGAERTSAEWLRACGRLPCADLVTVSGGEPALYEGLEEVLERAPWRRLHVNTNLAAPPDWLTPTVARRMYSVTLSLHFDPDDRRAAPFWERVTTVRQRAPGAYIHVRVVVTQQVRPDRIERAREMCEERGVCLALSESDTHWLYRERLPIRDGAAMCSAGHDAVVLLPDGALYRCLGMAYACDEPMGNVVDGVELLSTPAICERMVCSRAFDCEKCTTTLLRGTGELAW